jgi:hypothetical protein
MSLLPLEQQYTLIKAFLTEGKDEKALAKEFNISTRAVTSILQDQNQVNHVQKRYMDIVVARENKRISLIKDKLLSVFDETINDFNSDPNIEGKKYLFIEKIRPILNDLDKIQRLNQGTATEIKEEKSTHIDVAQVLHELQTPEQKRAFLLAGITPKQNN